MKIVSSVAIDIFTIMRNKVMRKTMRYKLRLLDKVTNKSQSHNNENRKVFLLHCSRIQGKQGMMPVHTDSRK